MIINPRYDIIPFMFTPVGHLVNYLDKLYRANLLRERFTDIKDPTPINVADVLKKQGDRFYFVFDKERDQIVSEFALSDTINDVGVVHFSMSPDVKGHEVLYLMREVTNEVIVHWKKQHSDEPFIRAMIGLTPIPNRRACLTIQRCGFKKIAVIPYAGRYNDKVCDAMLTLKTIDKILTNEVSYGK